MPKQRTHDRCRTQSRSRSECPHCVNHSGEYFRFMRDRYHFDVDLARSMVSDGRLPVELEEDCVKFSVRTSRIHEYHVPHVSITDPGIVAHVFFKPKGSRVVRAHLLIDGHHRAARCLQLDRPFMAFLLTESESEEILLKHPRCAVGHARD